MRINHRLPPPPSHSEDSPSGRGRKRVTSFIFVVLIVITLTGFGCRQRGGTTNLTSQSIVVWGLWQESESMSAAVDAFEAQTGVKVEYKKIASVADYERLLLEALAEGKGPDVFVIHHTWVEGKRGLMNPAPTEIIDVRGVQEEFVEVVEQDLVRDGLVYALPTSVDTLALYYNRALFNAAGISRPPVTWQDLHTAVEKLTRVNQVGTIEQAGAALGTAANINRAGDVAQLLMMQSEAEDQRVLRTEDGQVDLANEIGERSLTFYTDFANRQKKVYSWNLEQDYSLDAFAEGEVALMVNYSYHIPTIRAKNPRLTFSIAPMPQIADTQPVNMAAYWPFAVSNTSQAPEAAWQFVRVLTGPTLSAEINADQGVPPARRDSIEAAARDPLLGPFATQALTAASWPRVDINATDTIFHDMIDDVVTGKSSADNALRQAQDKIRQLGQNERETADFGL